MTKTALITGITGQDSKKGRRKKVKKAEGKK